MPIAIVGFSRYPIDAAIDAEVSRSMVIDETVMLANPPESV
jgi:hypothetical protein